MGRARWGHGLQRAWDLPTGIEVGLLPSDLSPRSTDAGAPDGGFGLVAMRQRIESLSGTLQVESEPGAGTAISACLPAAHAGAGA
jgi:sensor histidine kinase YesM